MILLKKSAFFKEIVKRTGDNFMRCLHCKTCASGCPVGDAMSYRPNGIIRLIQFGFKKETLESTDVWLCMGCNTCSTACPQAIDIAAVMDALREIAITEGVKIAESRILSFHEAVLSSIQRHGRTHKLEIMLKYKLKQLDLFSDMDIGLRMLAKRKLDLLPSKVIQSESVRNLFKEFGEKMP